MGMCVGSIIWILSVLCPSPEVQELDAEEKEEYINIVETLLKKQRVLWARVELCQKDDPVAKQMATDVRKVMNAVGIPDTVSVSEVFNNIDTMIVALKKTVAEM